MLISVSRHRCSSSCAASSAPLEQSTGQDNLAAGRGDLGQPLHRALLPDHHRLREPRLATMPALVGPAATPGIILLGLAVMGGGVATTAGGRQAPARSRRSTIHGLREMDRLIHPSIGRRRRARARASSAAAARARLHLPHAVRLLASRSGWSAFALRRAGFRERLVLAIAGALHHRAARGRSRGDAAYSLGSCSAMRPRSIFAAAMIVGRLETLVLIALFNPDFWRS